MKKRVFSALLCIVMTVVCLPTALAVAEPVSTTGDANADGTVNNADILLLTRYIKTRGRNITIY